MRALLGRVRAEALERAYPEVIVHAPADHPVLEAFRQASGKVIDQEEWEGTTSMYHIPDVGRFLDGDPAGADGAGRAGGGRPAAGAGPDGRATAAG